MKKVIIYPAEPLSFEACAGGRWRGERRGEKSYVHLQPVSMSLATSAGRGCHLGGLTLAYSEGRAGRDQLLH